MYNLLVGSSQKLIFSRFFRTSAQKNYAKQQNFHFFKSKTPCPFAIIIKKQKYWKCIITLLGARKTLTFSLFFRTLASDGRGDYSFLKNMKKLNHTAQGSSFYVFSNKFQLFFKITRFWQILKKTQATDVSKNNEKHEIPWILRNSGAAKIPA